MLIQVETRATAAVCMYFVEGKLIVGKASITSSAVGNQRDRILVALAGARRSENGSRCSRRSSVNQH
jgi:hypothetical protein